MAGDWIKWVKGLSRRREVVALAAKLGRNRREIACLCMEFWEYADDETADGHIAGATPGFIDELVGLQGFFSGLEEQGWVRATAQGITILNWDRHNGESSKRRARNAKTQAIKRSDRPPDKMSPPKGDILSLFSSLPPGLDSESFRTEWLKYVEYRKERKLCVLKSASARAKWEEMAAWGERRAIESIRQTIANGWQGLFEPKSNGVVKETKPQVDPKVAARRAKVRQWLRQSGDNSRSSLAAFRKAHEGCGLDDSQLEQMAIFHDWVAQEMMP